MLILCTHNAVTVTGNSASESNSRIVTREPNPDRDRGILTSHDRSFLLAAGDEGVRANMSDTATRQKRHKIRNRFRNGLIDMQYLLLLENDDFRNLFPSDKLEGYDLGIVHGSVLTAVYHMIRADGDREDIFETLRHIITNDVIREYADKHGVYAPAKVKVEIDSPSVEECPPLDEVLKTLEAGEDIPYRAHMALDYAGMHPNPEEYL